MKKAAGVLKSIYWVLHKTIRYIIRFPNWIMIHMISQTCGKHLHVNGYTRVNSNTYLGNNVSFNGMKIIGRGQVIIGDYFHSGEECIMISENHNYDKGSEIPYDSTVIEKPISIGDCVWMGSRVTVLGGISIGEGAVIQAGSVVVKDIPPMAVVGGNPAIVIKYRDIEHYRLLKENRKFH